MIKMSKRKLLEIGKSLIWNKCLSSQENNNKKKLPNSKQKSIDSEINGKKEVLDNLES